ncbi:sucrase ferredoxin [Amycolatopsis sp., V23-08]|uniref:Sucrase ferredoxin n=1 Tax=Amycolatopsis heterodermiae TaxID=3110235 RepID=A0ABU5R4A0_9PSEU|nr:sucrase ferredoxin [Amycolatopsis sp., V23-08]MEA5361032.1 sucrase ferredoxin [Amycolatopsis sp., V23-08]
MSAPARARCADLAGSAGDRREGTAPPADRWLLIEHPGPWERLALTSSGLEPAALTTWAAGHGGRVALIRRPGRRSGTGGHRWFKVDARPGHEDVRTGVYRDTTEIATLPFHSGRSWSRPLNLVCTHGRHDPCCAVRGRPLAAALAAADPEGTWECSHLGGCRFAPAVVLLPHGFTFGGVDPDEAAGIARSYARGILEPAKLRGRSSLSPVVQTAHHHALAVTGARGVDDLRLVTAEREDGKRWRVTFADPACTVVLRERPVTLDRPLTCAARRPGRVQLFDLLEAGR